MWEEILKAIPVFFASMLKFIFGPAGGYAAGLHLATTIIATVAGMMTVVVVITYFGSWFKKNVLSRFGKRASKFSPGNKRFVQIWKKYGLIGVALLTPIILTPIGGSLLAASSGSPKDKIIFFMLISASLWSVIFSVLVYFFGNEVVARFF